MRWGLRVWDGASYIVRDTYPTEIDQLRIVQYDSCRGLEGWITIAVELDELYRYKRETWQPRAAEPGIFADDPEEAHRHAVRWLLIPLSRAVDTLVIQMGAGPPQVQQALRKTASACADFVEWHHG